MTLCDIVVCSPGDAKFSRLIHSLQSAPCWRIGDVARISDATSMCEGYNRGAARGSSPWIIFCHDDIAVVDFNRDSLDQAFATQDLIGACGTRRLVGADWYDSSPHHLVGSVIAPLSDDRHEWQVFGRPQTGLVPVEAVDGIFIACRRPVWSSLRFDEILPGFTGYDIDFSYRAKLHGYNTCVDTNLILYHQSHPAAFSAEKLEKWERNQSIIRKKFQLRGYGQGYLKHRNVLPPGPWLDMVRALDTAG